MVQIQVSTVKSAERSALHHVIAQALFPVLLKSGCQSRDDASEVYDKATEYSTQLNERTKVRLFGSYLQVAYSVSGSASDI